MKKLQVIATLSVLAALLMFSNCGYRLSGFSKQIPDYIRTISIPDFENKTTRFQADQFITFAVKEEFIKRSKLALTDDSSSADSLLEGTINSFNVKPISYSENASANLYRVTISISVRFIDLKTNEIIFEGASISFNDTYSIESGEDIDDDFFSQETETLLKIAEEFAASIVTTILENF
jgi:outer membrane lipopolysaccharide assembly protein LptE/RlpB